LREESPKLRGRLELGDGIELLERAGERIRQTPHRPWRKFLVLWLKVLPVYLGEKTPWRFQLSIHKRGIDPRQLSAANHSALVSDLQIQPAESCFPPEKIKQLVCELEVPFDESAIEWRVTNTAKGELRGQVVPYADPRAYTDRLNILLTPAGWTRKYAVHTSANFERAKDKKIVAKVLVTCELTIFGLGSHSATGEEFADNENALTAAEAQSFKRAASCFGLGRYLYHFTGVWVDLDERKRPKSTPRLFGWATPQGWRQGLRPGQEANAKPANPSSCADRQGNPAEAGWDGGAEDTSALICQIEAMAEPLGRRLYRGILKTVARVWNPSEIRAADVLSRVLAQMQSAERGLRRLQAALDRVGPETLVPILRSLQLNSLNQVDSLDNLKKIVLEIERAAKM
jgi:hypothetical protein